MYLLFKKINYSWYFKADVILATLNKSDICATGCIDGDQGAVTIRPRPKALS